MVKLLPLAHRNRVPVHPKVQVMSLMSLLQEASHKTPVQHMATSAMMCSVMHKRISCASWMGDTAHVGNWKLSEKCLALS